MKKNEVKKLIKNYVKENLELKIVNIDNKYNLWLAVNESGVPYQINVDYEYISFSVTELSAYHLSNTYVYNYYDSIGFVRL